MDKIIGEIAASADEDGAVIFDEADVVQWAKEQALTVSEFLDRFGLEIARKYDSGMLFYSFCDDIVNELWVMLLDWMDKPMAEPWPNTFYEVFDAFDAGEFHRLADRSDDPIADFTKPLIAEIVRKNG